MEQVVELFGRYRSREIAFKELTSTLKTFLSHHPQASRQGLGWLDLAQQRQPMPVTDFIQLRADMDYLLRSLALQTAEVDPTRIGSATPRTVSMSAPSNDMQSTVVQRPAEDVGATVVNNAAIALSVVDEDSAPTVIKAPAASEDNDATQVAANPQAFTPPTAAMKNEDATRIAPVRNDVDDATVVAKATSVADTEATVVAAKISTDERTVIATPKSADPTLVVARAATPTAPPEDATHVAAPREASPKMPHSQRVPPRTTTLPDKSSPPAAPAPRSSSLVLGVVGGIAAAIVLVGAIALWKSAGTQSQSVTPPLASSVATTPNSSITPQNDTVINTSSSVTESPTIEPADTLDAPQGETVMLQLEIVSDTTPADKLSLAANAVMSTAAIRPSVQPIPPQEPIEPLHTDINGLLTQVKQRVDNGRLLPADDPNSATFAIKALIAKAPDSNEVSEARKILSQAHLELARQAREKGDLDAAQTHLDNAFDVRLMQ